MDINLGNCAAALLAALVIIIAQARKSLRDGEWHRWFSLNRGVVKRRLLPDGQWQYLDANHS